MKFFGDRTVLLINLSALLLACILVAGRAFVEKTVLGNIEETLWQLLIPVAVMFAIRNKYFSYGFLFLYSLFVLNIAREVWLIQVGSPMGYGGKNMGFVDGLMIPFSLACLVIYAIAMTLINLVRVFTRR